jgi:hypothetical protein
MPNGFIKTPNIKLFKFDSNSFFSYNLEKGNPMQVTPACVESGEGSERFISYGCSIFLCFCKMLFLGL